MRVLIADSGGSKTDWILVRPGTPDRSLHTAGLNPNLVGPEFIGDTLQKEVRAWLDAEVPDKLLFFGAGLTRKPARAKMKRLLQTHLRFDGHIEVQSDVMAAARACLGDEKGLVGILGTGSIAVRFNGRRITAHRGGLGYLIGDVGGGAALGRVFFRRLVNRDLQPKILRAYPLFSGIEIKAVLDTLYNHPAPAQFLAAQVPFLKAFQSEPEIQEIIRGQFDGFLNVYLRPLIKKKSERIEFLGGVARAFSLLLENMCRERGHSHVHVFKEAPIQALARFLTESA